MQTILTTLHSLSPDYIIIKSHKLVICIFKIITCETHTGTVIICILYGVIIHSEKKVLCFRSHSNAMCLTLI